MLRVGAAKRAHMCGLLCILFLLLLHCCCETSYFAQCHFFPRMRNVSAMSFIQYACVSAKRVTQLPKCLAVIIHIDMLVLGDMFFAHDAMLSR